MQANNGQHVAVNFEGMMVYMLAWWSDYNQNCQSRTSNKIVRLVSCRANLKAIRVTNSEAADV